MFNRRFLARLLPVLGLAIVSPVLQAQRFPIGTSQSNDPMERPSESRSVAARGATMLPCENPGGGALFSLKAVAVNGLAIAPTNAVSVMPGDIIDTEIFISCWGSDLPMVDTFQASILVRAGAVSGDFGTILPLGWDAPLFNQYPPCTDPDYPIEFPGYGNCVGLAHNPTLGIELDVQRADFLLAGLDTAHAVDHFSLLHFRYGATSLEDGVSDDGFVKYGGNLRLAPSDASCGSFTFDFEPHDVAFCASNQNILLEPGIFPQGACPSFESLHIEVCADDGLFCNGVESCDSESGCQITPPPSCDDGVACTIDACDEMTDGCSHVLNHVACDDGNVCTRDECTPTGCANIDDQCGDIPTTSNWGLVILALSFLIMAKLRKTWSVRN